MLNVVRLSVAFFFIVMLIVVILNNIKLRIIMLSRVEEQTFLGGNFDNVSIKPT